jgi:hypothetical protein
MTGYTSVVEVLDLNTGRVLASVQFPGESISLLPGGYATRRREDADGFAVFDVWQLELLKPPSSP